MFLLLFTSASSDWDAFLRFAGDQVAGWFFEALVLFLARLLWRRALRAVSLGLGWVADVLTYAALRVRVAAVDLHRVAQGTPRPVSAQHPSPAPKRWGALFR